MLVRSATAPLLSSLTLSATEKTATTPFPSTPRYPTVPPWSPHCSAFLLTSLGSDLVNPNLPMSLPLPAYIRTPLTLPVTPSPLRISWSSAWSLEVRVTPSSCALFTNADAMGWLLSLSSTARQRRISFLFFHFPTASSLSTANSPCVSVPVLSQHTTLTFARASRCTPPFTMIPLCAVAASPATYVTGVDIIRAHGHAMTIRTMPW
mmetsp:Transcript_19232/g.39730  ORF Transcript_19232/g.39730 Transcript_19232/m.39730 type:complete len:207 (-) Transcript_19232:2284-2904(-)